MPKYDGTVYRSGRVYANLTQEQAAGLLYISVRAISDWERGETLPDNDMIFLMAKVYGDEELPKRHLKANTPYGKYIPDPKERHTDGENVMLCEIAADDITDIYKKSKEYLKNDGSFDEDEIAKLEKQMPRIENVISDLTGFVKYIRTQAKKAAE